MSADVKAVLVGTPQSLFDLRYPGVLDEYRRVEREVADGRARLVFEHPTRPRIEVVVTVTPVSVGAARPANATEVDEVVLTYAGAPAMVDPQDRGALEHYYEVSRREEGDTTVLTLLRRSKKNGGLELAIRVHEIT